MKNTITIFLISLFHFYTLIVSGQEIKRKGYFNFTPVAIDSAIQIRLDLDTKDGISWYAA